MTFATLLTADGSTTAHFGPEPMHNLQGALGETVYVYGEAIRRALENDTSHRFLVIGLGLAYIEWVVLAESALKNRTPEITSFESEPVLNREFQNYLEGGDSHLFSESLRAVESHYHVQVKTLAHSAFAGGRLQVSGALARQTAFTEKFSCILFDPYSQKTNPSLWTEDFLANFIARSASDSCVFASYASTGALKRALKLNKFEIIGRKGFGRKRECTLAVRTAASANFKGQLRQ